MTQYLSTIVYNLGDLDYDDQASNPSPMKGVEILVIEINPRTHFDELRDFTVQTDYEPLFRIELSKRGSVAPG